MTGVQQGRACPALLSRMEGHTGTLQTSNVWLDDQCIDHAQALLKIQHPDVGGLYATTSLSLLTSPASTSTRGFVQILHVNSNHWVTVSNINCGTGTVNIYDSSGQVSTDEFIYQITGLLSFAGHNVHLQWPVVQQQRGSNDCGLFAIANSLALCRGEDPSRMEYQQSAMRQHLLTCFQVEHIKPFPPVTRFARTVEVSVHCLCRRNIWKGGPELVSCRRCSKCFHTSCVSVNSDGFVCTRCNIVQIVPR